MHRWTQHGCHPPCLGWEGRKKEGNSFFQSARLGRRCKYNPQSLQPSPPDLPGPPDPRWPPDPLVSHGTAAGPCSLPAHDTLMVPRSLGQGQQGQNGCHYSHCPPLRALFGSCCRYLSSIKMPIDEWGASSLLASSEKHHSSPGYFTVPAGTSQLTPMVQRLLGDNPTHSPQPQPAAVGDGSCMLFWKGLWKRP